MTQIESESGPSSAQPRLPGAWASRRLWIGVLLLGAGLRLWQYFGNPSLWMDELALTRNVLERPLGLLLGAPLDFAQVAPPGFLLLLKSATWWLGDSEYALRLVPLLGALVSLPVFLRLAKRLPTPSAGLIALFLFAISPPLVRHGAEVKQYSTDVAATIALALLAVRWLEAPSQRRALALGVAAAAGSWFSQTLVFVGAGAFAALGGLALLERRRQAIRMLVPAALVAAVGMAGAVLFARSHILPAVQAMMNHDWRGGFVPWEPVRALEWLGRKLPGPFEVEYRLPAPAATAYFLLILLGWWFLWRRNRGLSLLVALPVLGPLAAAVTHLYPFDGRLVVFLLPLALLALSMAIDVIRIQAAAWRPVAGAIVTGLLLLPAAGAMLAYRPVVRFEDTRPALRHIATERQSDDPVYVYFTGWLAAGYYGPRLGLPAQRVDIGRCHVGNPAGYRSELNVYAGTPRLWLFFTHSMMADRLGMLAYLDSVGVRTDSLVIRQHPEFREPGASVYRYDLSAMAPSPDTIPHDPDPDQICLSVGPHMPVDSALVGGRRRSVGGAAASSPAPDGS